jgi:hypothetical protein
MFRCGTDRQDRMVKAMTNIDELKIKTVAEDDTDEDEDEDDEDDDLDDDEDGEE